MPPARPITNTLKDRELDILQLVAAGQANSQIANELHLSEDTVKTYLRSLYHKLNTPSRAGAVAQGFLHGHLNRQNVQPTIPLLARTINPQQYPPASF